jgi:lipoprotein-releasing system permease protein
MIAVGGVVVGVSALIVVMGVMNGLQRDLRQRLLIGSPDVRVLSASPEMRIEQWQGVRRTVEAQPGVVAAAPFVTTQCLVSAGHSYMEFGNVIGLEPQSGNRPDVTDIRAHAVSGDFRFATAGGPADGIALGKTIARNLDAMVGDSVTVVCLGQGGINPVTGAPSLLSRRFEVTGIFETGLYEYDTAFMYVALTAAQELAGLGTAVTGIEVKTRDRMDAAITGRELAGLLGPRFQTVDWQQQNRSLFQALNLEKATMGLILSLIVLVASFNIVSILTMVVAEKRGEIGILKAMGMPSHAVRRVFLTQGLVIGLVGTTLGLLVGIGVSLMLGKYQLIKLNAEVYSIDHLPVATASLDVVVTIITSVAVAALATLYPSVQAGRLYPIEAIRHE